MKLLKANDYQVDAFAENSRTPSHQQRSESTFPSSLLSTKTPVIWLGYACSRAGMSKGLELPLPRAPGRPVSSEPIVIVDSIFPGSWPVLIEKLLRGPVELCGTLWRTWYVSGRSSPSDQGLNNIPDSQIFI